MPAHAKSIAEYIGSLTIGQGRYAGQPFRLLGWQKRFLSGAFKGPGDAALSMGRGGGKSTFIAAIGCAAVDVDGPLVEPMAESVVVASSFDQGYSTVFRHALHFLQPSFERWGVGPRKRFRVQDSANRASVTDRETGAILRVLGSDPRRMHGLQPRLLILDESAQWEESKRDRALAALKTSRGKIPDAKALWLGTRPAAPDHPFQRALDGNGVRFALSYQAPTDAPPFRKSTWMRANPSLRHGFPDLEAVIRGEAADAKRDPDAMLTFRALRLNQGTSDTARSVLLDVDAWRRAEGLPPRQRQGGAVWGVDCGTSAAQSAVAVYWRSGDLDAVACFPELPTLAERGLADGVGSLYRLMADRGELIQAGRRVSDLVALLSEALGRWGRPAAVVCDRWRMAELGQALEALRITAPVVVRGQGFRDGGADVRDFRRAILAGHVRPRRSLLLRSAMAEARTISDAAGAAKLSKGSQGGRRVRARDDAAAAAILAVAVGFRQWGSAKRSRPRRSVVV